MKVYIYALICPLKNEIRYIGKTVQKLNARLRGHLSLKLNDSTYRANWIKSLIIEGLKPEITLIEECTDIDWEDREKYWIDFYSKKYNLVNHSKGGQGRCENKLSTKQKMSEILKERWKDISYKNKMCDMSKELWKNEDYRKNRITDEAKERIRQANIGRKSSNELKQRLSKINKERWKDKTYKEKMAVAHKHIFKPVIAYGIEYESLNEAARQIKMNSGTLYRKILSNKYPEFIYKY
jgi:group I intron endonuclease